MFGVQQCGVVRACVAECGIRPTTWAIAVLLAGCSADVPGWDGSQWRMSSTPDDGATGVDRQARIVVDLERLPLLNTINTSTVHLHAGVIDAWVDISLRPVTRQLWLTPRAPLEPDTQYELAIQGLNDLDGEGPPEPFRTHFTTGRALGQPATEPLVDAAKAVKLLAANCAGASCHGGDDPADGLDLASATGIEATAKNHIATQAYVGTPDGANKVGTLFVASPLIIDSAGDHGEPARSYLVYKMLADPHIVGDPMPPPQHRPLLTRADVQMVADWIHVGAPTP
jgi:hypothetical protein